VAVAPLTPPLATTPAAEPDWIRDHPVVQKALEFLGTAVAFSLRPAAFTREWLDGTRQATNPLSLIAASLTLVATLRVSLGAGQAESGPATGWWGTLAGTAVPYLYSMWIGLLIHAFSGGFRRDRPRLRTTVALMLFASGGPLTLGRMLVEGTAAAFRAFGAPVMVHDGLLGITADQHPVARGVTLAIAALATLFCLRAVVISVAVAHRMRAWVVALATVAAITVGDEVYGFVTRR